MKKYFIKPARFKIKKKIKNVKKNRFKVKVKETIF